MVEEGENPLEITQSGASATGDQSFSGGFVAGRDINAQHLTIEAPRERSRAAWSSLPRPAGDFTGRAPEIRRIEATVAEGSSAPLVVVIYNGPGSGKSTLAVHMAHRLSGAFPQAQLHVHLGGAGQLARSTEDVLRELLVLQGVPADVIPEDLQGRAALYRATLPVGSLVVLDNAASEEQVELLLPTKAGCLAFVTSRSDLEFLEGAVRVEVGRMPDDDAYALLVRLLTPERSATDPEAVRKIARLCGRLPLALRIAAAYLGASAKRRMPLAEFAARLQDEDTRLDLLKVGSREVRASFSLSYVALDPGAARLLRLLGALRVPDVDFDLALAVDGSDSAEHNLDELINAHLVELVGNTRVGFHDLMRLFAEEKSGDEETPEAIGAALARAGAWCLQRAAIWQAEGAFDRFEEERPVFLAQLKRSRDDEFTWRLSACLADFFDVRGHRADWLAVAEAAEAAATRLGDPLALGVSLHHLARILRLERRTTEAIEAGTQALALLTAPALRAQALENLGILYREQHRYEEAIESLQTAAQLFGSLDDARGEGLILQQLGHVQSKRREFPDAERTLERAAGLLGEAGDRTHEGWAHNNLITVHGAQWHEAAALEHFEKARDLFTELGGGLGIAWALNHVGRVHRQYGRTTEQLAAHEQALELFTELGDRYGTAWATLDLGLARGDAGLLQQAYDMFDAIGEQDGRGWALVWLSQASGNPDHVSQALDAFDVIGNLQGRGTALSIRGDLARADGDAELAAASYEAALPALRQAVDPYREALVLLGLAALDRDAGRTESAVTRTQAADFLLAQTGAPKPA